MAKKKNKYRIKLNNKIKSYFDGLAFEDGVATLEDDKLVELVMLLDLNDVLLDNRDDMIKALRRTWSQDGVKTREMIVTYLTQPYKVLVKENSSNKPVDRVVKILHILSEIEHTFDEEEMILRTLIDTKASKITPQKIQNTLAYIRHKQKLKTIQKELDIEFDSLDRMFWYESFRFSLKEYDFNKVLLCMSDSIDFDQLFKIPSKESISKLQSIKQQTIIDKQKHIDEFISSLIHKKHLYLDDDTIYHALKTIPPEIDISHAPLEFEIIEKLIKDINPKYYLIDANDHFTIQKSKEYMLFETSLEYDLSVSYEKPYIYHLIWLEEKLPIAQDFSDLHTSLKQHFEYEIKELLDEMHSMTQKT